MPGANESVGPAEAATAPLLGAALPVDRLLAVSGGQGLPEWSTGAALVADISGFSTLASRLAQALGPKLGAEALATTVDAVFEALIAELHAFGGSVVGFAGDAVTCWFDDRPLGETATPAPLRAIAAGTALQGRIEELAAWRAPDDEPLRLAVRAGTAAGSARRFVVGDPSVRLLDVIAGATVLRAAAAEGLARPGELVVASEVAVAAGGELRSEPTGEAGFARVTSLAADVPRSPWPDVPAGVLRPEVVRRWHDPAVLASLAAGSELLADLRLAAVLFVRHGDLDYDGDSAAVGSLDARVRAAQHSLRRYDGTLLDVAIDAKGTYSCTVVGAPVAQPDAVVRAAEAALELRTAAGAVGRPGADVRIGIADGRVWAGMYGTSARGCYAVRGDAVNLAARLMQRAEPGQILVSPRAASALTDSHILEPGGALALKGQAEPVEVSSLEGPRDGTRRRPGRRSPTPLVGRGAELRLLTQALAEVAAGGRHVIAVRGQPGVGKSRLLEAAHEEARARGLRVLAGVASPIERGTPYFASRPLFAELLGIQGGDVSDAELDRLLEPLGPDGREQAALLDCVLPIMQPETEATRWMTPDVRQENALRLLVRLFEAHRGGQSLVVSFDDAQWLDSASWALLLRLARTSDRLLVLVGMRPDAPEELTALLETAASTEVALTPLAREDALELVCHALRVEALPDPVARFVAERAEGHPFFSLEIAYALRDAGLLELADGSSRLAPGADLDAVEFPETVEGVIANRVDRLAPEAHALLKVGSVLGRAFTEEVLRRLAVAGLGPRLHDDLAHLEALDLLTGEGAASAGVYSFRHVLIRDVVYGRLLHAQRRDLHRRAAEHFERAGDAPRGVLAHHWDAAGVPDRAVPHLEAAGEAALGAGAFRESADFLGRALALAETAIPVPTERRATWEWLAAQAHYRLGALAESRELAESAVVVFDRRVQHVAPALLAEVGRQVLHRLLPRRFLGRAPAEEHPRLRRAVRAHFNLAELHYMASEKTRSAFAALRALNLAERAGPSLELVEAYGAICIIGSVVGRRGIAERYAALGLATAERIGLPYARAIILHQISLFESAAGRFQRVVENEREAADLFRRLRDTGRVRDSLGVAGVAAYQAGRLHLAERLLNELQATREGGEEFLQEGWATTWLGGVALRGGDARRAMEYLREAAERKVPEGLDVTTISTPGLLALALADLGRREEAAREATRVRALIAKTRGRPTGHGVLDGYEALALVSLGLWDTAGSAQEASHWARCTEDACRYLRAYAKVFPTGEPARRFAEGERSWRLGRRRRALASLRRAAAAAERLDMRYELMLAHRALAEHLPAADPDRAWHADAARLAFERMTAPDGGAVVAARKRVPAETAVTPA